MDAAALEQRLPAAPGLLAGLGSPGRVAREDGRRTAIASRRDVVLITVAAVALVGAGAIFWTSGGAGGGGNRDFPEGHPYMCAGCGQVILLSDRELFQLKREARESESLEAGRVVCAACGSESTQPALKCPHCGEYFPRPGPGRPVCPHCKEPFPSVFDD